MEDINFLAAVLFFICSIAAGSVIQWGVSKIRVYKPPVSILWFVFGILICLLELCVIPKHRYTLNGHEESEITISPDSALGLISIGIAEASRIPHNALYYLVLPILLYDATQLVNWHHFKKNIKTGLMLAVSGIVLQVFVLGALMQWSFSEDDGGSAPAAAGYGATFEAPAPVYIAPLGGTPLRDGSFTELAGDAPFMGANPPGRALDLELSHAPLYSDMDEDSSLRDISGEPSFASSCMIAAAVGATDPIAVLGVLEALDAPVQLVSLFDCESLINDGTAIFMFTFFKSLSRGTHMTWSSAAAEFFRLLFGGPAVGILSAAVLYRCIKHFRFHPFDVTLLVIAVAYMVFFVAEIYLQTSAPLAIVVYGLYFKAYAKAAFDADTGRVHNTLVRGIATAMTSLVFIISGIACMRITWDTVTGAMNLEIPNDYSRRKLGAAASSAMRDLWHVPVFYLFCNLARALMILLFSPFIKTDLGAFSWKEGVLLWWGGLRGGVCLILALLIEQDEDIPSRLAGKAALYCASAVFLILIINGTTFEFLFRWLKPYKGNPFKEVYLLKVLKFIDEEYDHEANLLQSHWLYQGTNILRYSSLLVPVLGDSTMHEIRGLQVPPISVRKTLDSFDLTELEMPQNWSASTEPSRRSSPERSAAGLTARSSGGELFGPPESRGRVFNLADLEAGQAETQESGHDAAARIQNLKTSGRHDLDLIKTVEKLQLGEAELSPPSDEESDPDEFPKISRASEVQSQTVSEKAHQTLLTLNSAAILDAVPSTQSNGDARKSVRWQENPVTGEPGFAAPPHLPEIPQQLRRPPILRSGSYVYRIRSEPYAASLDVASTLRPPAEAHLSNTFNDTYLADSAAITARDADWASHFLSRKDYENVPRTMSVPDRIGAVKRTDLAEREPEIQRRVRPWHREGEVVTMVVNSMRHLYRRMYDQSFISGTCLVAFMSANDIVNDYAIAENRVDRCRALWLLLEHRSLLDEAIDGKRVNPMDHHQGNTRWRDHCPQLARQTRERRDTRVRQMVETVTPFDIEWVLMISRLRLMSRWKNSILRTFGRFCLCQPRAAGWAVRWQRFIIWLWALVGPRQTFPALDDLQTLCAYVDVHEEMLVRGDKGLRFILGHKLLRSYTARTVRGKTAVRHLKHFYPESFPYALICHGAIFLANLKIQLVEEYHERGLLMTSDCEALLEVLKRQIVRITKYHPRFLFS